MINLERVGDVEIVAPDPQMMELVRDLVRQHDKILEVNAHLIEVLSRPLLRVAPVGEEDTL